MTATRRALVGALCAAAVAVTSSPATVEARGWVATWHPDLSAGPHRADFEPLLAEHLDSAVQTVTSTLGITLRRPVSVYVHGKPDYRAKFGNARANRYSAHYRRGQIHVNGGAKIGPNFRALMHHEMVHAVLDSRGKGRNVPTWLNEGLAEWFQYRALGDTDLSSSNKMQLKNTHRQRRLPPLVWRGGLHKYNYLLSWASTLWIADSFGEDALFSLARDLAGGASHADAFQEHLRLRIRDIEPAFRKWVSRLDP